jgi:hypothetical protein
VKFPSHHESSVLLNAPAERAFAARWARKCARVLGMTLCLKEIVIERQPPLRKAWQTVDAKLLVIGQYRLGFDISPNGNRSALRVLIDGRMAHDAARHFA